MVYHTTPHGQKRSIRQRTSTDTIFINGSCYTGGISYYIIAAQHPKSKGASNVPAIPLLKILLCFSTENMHVKQQAKIHNLNSGLEKSIDIRFKLEIFELPAKTHK